MFEQQRDRERGGTPRQANKGIFREREGGGDNIRIQTQRECLGFPLTFKVKITARVRLL